MSSFGYHGGFGIVLNVSEMTLESVNDSVPSLSTILQELHSKP